MVAAMQRLVAYFAIVFAAASCGPSGPNPARLPAGNGWQCLTAQGAAEGTGTGIQGVCDRQCPVPASVGAPAPGDCMPAAQAWCFTSNDSAEYSCFATQESCMSSLQGVSTPDFFSQCGLVN